jgi:hypothetical protein
LEIESILVDLGGYGNAHKGIEIYGTSTKVHSGSEMLKIPMIQIIPKTPSMHRD